MKENRFDVVIAGSGMGGLICGDLLSREGYSVCILERNQQIGGALQIFSRDKRIFDSGVHYIGGLAPGQNLYKVFSYLGLMKELSFEPCDEGPFDTILIGGDARRFPIMQGYESFIRALSAEFPGEEQNIRTYADAVRDLCTKFPMYNLRYTASDAEKMSVMGIDTEAFVASITQNETLRAVLCGNNILYAGRGNETPFYIHALILNSYLESAWKCVGGGGQIARCLARNIRSYGGLIRTRSGVARFVEEGGRIDHVLLMNGEKVYGDYFISNIHPAVTIDMVQGQTLRPGYRRRITEVRDTVGCFTLYISLKPGSLRYEQTNYYVHEPGRLWDMASYQPGEWPLGYAVFFGKDRKDPQWASTLSVITYMRYEDVLPWAESYNTAASPSPRAPEYQAFKQKMTDRLLDRMEEKFPGIRGHIQATYASTPLTFRDYLGDRSGSIYGIAKDYRHVLETHIASRTRIQNLFLTGQNLNLHGVLGTTISALITVRDLTGNNSIIEKINNGKPEQAHP